MFTGIVQGSGTLMSRKSTGGGLAFELEAGFDITDPQEGESISVNGVCLTAYNIRSSRFTVDVSPESISRTTLGELNVGGKVNLERALRLSDRLGGHLVSGHVDGLARLVSRTVDARSERFLFETDRSLARYIASKGSACLDGVSLTVNEVEDNRFSICIIPHTLTVTTLGGLAVGGKVNLEVDLIARYLDRLNQYDPSIDSSVPCA